jgi:hypothetical protein
MAAMAVDHIPIKVQVLGNKGYVWDPEGLFQHDATDQAVILRVLTVILRRGQENEA